MSWSPDVTRFEVRESCTAVPRDTGSGWPRHPAASIAATVTKRHGPLRHGCPLSCSERSWEADGVGGGGVTPGVGARVVPRGCYIRRHASASDVHLAAPGWRGVCGEDPAPGRPAAGLNSNSSFGIGRQDGRRLHAQECGDAVLRVLRQGGRPKPPGIPRAPGRNTQAHVRSVRSCSRFACARSRPLSGQVDGDGVRVPRRVDGSGLSRPP